MTTVDWISEDRKFESFAAVLGEINEEDKKKIYLAKFILSFNKNNSKEILKKIENLGVSYNLIYQCIEYLFSVRPNKTREIFALFLMLVKKTPYNNYPQVPLFRKVLIIQGIFLNYDNIPEDEKLCDALDIYPKGSLERAIKDDDVDLFIELISKPGFDSNQNISIDKDSLVYNVSNSNSVTLLQLMAFFGASKVFKYAFSAGTFSDFDLHKYAIAGGNYEIIHILKDKSPNYFDNCFEISVKYHHYEISNWLLDNYKCEVFCRYNCKACFNFLAYNFMEKNKIDVYPINKEISLEQIIQNCDIDKLKGMTITNIERAFPVPVIDYLFENNIINADYMRHCYIGVGLDAYKLSHEKYSVPIDHCIVSTAIIRNNVQLIKYAALTAVHDFNLDKAILEAAYFNVEIFHILYKRRTELLFYEGKEEKPIPRLLHSAIAGHQIDVLKFLVEKGYTIEEKGYRESTPFLEAAFYYNMPAIKFLFEECNCNPHALNDCGEGALHCVASGWYYHSHRGNQKEIVEYLVNVCKCDPHHKDKNGRTCCYNINPQYLKKK